MKVGKWFWKKQHEIDGEIMVTNDASKVLYSTDEWYHYYRQCSKNIRKIRDILEYFSNQPQEYSKTDKFWDEMKEIGNLAFINDPEEQKERILQRKSKSKDERWKGFDIGEYKRECINKLKYIKKGSSLLVEDRIYQTVDMWTREMKGSMKEFKDKIFHVEKVDHNTQKIWRVK